MHDLVIRNATVIDGLGNPGREGESLAVREGRIAALGADVGRGAEEIDAEGRVLCPGIVDLHTHFDAQLTWDGYATPSVGLGVTTVVAGNCGFTIAPCREADRDRTLRNLTHVEGMSIRCLARGGGLGLRDVSRVPRDARAKGHGAERRLLRRPLPRSGPTCSARRLRREPRAQAKSRR